jgi:hypothetical protein
MVFVSAPERILKCDFWMQVRVQPPEEREGGEDEDKSTKFRELKRVIIEKLSSFSSPIGATKAEVAVGMMDITASLLKFGFFHTGTHWSLLKADLQQVCLRA